MSRLADYFVVVGYDHEKKREYFHYFSRSLDLDFVQSVSYDAADASSTCFSCTASSSII